MSDYRKNFAYVILRVILYALLLTPLWVWSFFLFPFITSKILYLRTLVELALLLYIPLAIRYPELRPRFNRATGAVWIYFGVIVLASIFGVNFSSSLWGDIERGEGLVTLLHFVVFFTILPAVFNTREDWYRYLFGAVTSTAVVGLYGLAQYFRLSFVLNLEGSRPLGTIGNASFFAGFMIFGIMLSLYLLQWTEKPAAKWYLRSVFGFELLMLYLSQSRGAFLAAAAAFFIYFLFAVFKSRRRLVRLGALVGLVFLASSAVLLYASRQSEFVRTHGTLNRLASISRADITTQSRLDTWNAALAGWKDRWFLGYGHNNFNVAFNKYFPARIFKDAGSQVWFDRAHNTLLDVLVMYGVVGLAAYLTLLAIALAIIFKLYRRPPADWTWRAPFILFILIFAYVFQNLFVFDTPATYLILFILLAHIAFLKNYHLGGAQPQKAGYPAGFILPVILSVLLAAVFFFVNLKPAFANYNATWAVKLAKGGQYREMRARFERALSYGTYMDAEIRQRLADYSGGAVDSRQFSAAEEKEFYQNVLEELRKNIQEAPRDVKNYIYLMNILNRFGSDPKIIEEAEEAGRVAITLSPTRPQVYFETGQTEFNKGDFDTGLSYFRKSLLLNPQPKETNMNYLLALIIAGQSGMAEEQLRVLTEKLKYHLEAADYMSIARAYYHAKNLPKVIENYQNALVLQPDDADLYAKLAATYGEMCDLVGARAAVLQAIKFNASFQPEGQAFLRQLETKCKK